MKKKLFPFFCLSILSFIIFPPQKVFSQDTAVFEKLVPLHQPKKPAGPHDWLATHEEPGQTFSEYTASRPPGPDAKYAFIYIVLLGDFNEAQQKILQRTSRYIEVYFQMPVKFSEPIPLANIPVWAHRIHPQTGDAQILTSYILEDILIPHRPKDAFCLIAFTSSDLWPGQGWNFVFGQASMEDRVGVWSIYRKWNPQKGDKDFNLGLRRTIQTGTHEIGHMFGLTHCIYYECNMNGSNSRIESDARPLWECPVCLRKLTWTLKFDVGQRYRKLSAICKEFGFTAEEKFFEKSFKGLEK